MNSEIVTPESINRLWRWIVGLMVTTLVIGYALGVVSTMVLYDSL